MVIMKRCLAQLTLSGPWGTEVFWPGLEVNIARELAPGYTVGDAVAGREACFEDVVASPAPAQAPKSDKAAVAPREE